MRCLKLGFSFYYGWLILFVILVRGFYGEPKIPAANINTQFTICDSLSKGAIPVVRITIDKFKQSFVTHKSAFYLPLAAGTYRFLLEADRYETLTTTVEVSTQNYVFPLKMVAEADRIKIREFDSLCYFQSAIVKDALQNIDFARAELHLDSLKFYSRYKTAALDSAKDSYANARKSWTDSFFRVARECESIKKYADALFYYHQLYAYDSLLSEAGAGIKRVDSLVVASVKKNPPTVAKKMTPEEIEKLFQEGHAKFVAADFVGAKKIFQKVLANNPNHEKAKDYLKRTEARLKALGK
jgi:tetratricopeptide (TPR) repeat protein